MIDITWTATSLGADFSHTLVQRLHPSLAGWNTIFRINDETIAEVTDREARQGAEESYRVIPVDIYGSPAVPAATISATAPSRGYYQIASNAAPTLTQRVRINRPATFNLPDLDQVTAHHGADGQRLHRATEKLGMVLDGAIHLHDGGTTQGPDLWEDYVDLLRTPGLPALALTNPWGWRRYVRIRPTAANHPITDYASLAAQFITATDTPPVITIEAA